MHEFINNTFGPLFHTVFEPINLAIMDVYMPWARILAIGFFVGTMIWAFMLRKEYLQIDAPSKSIVADLRVWTVISMLPHVVIYFLL